MLLFLSATCVFTQGFHGSIPLNPKVERSPVHARGKFAIRLVDGAAKLKEWRGPPVRTFKVCDNLAIMSPFGTDLVLGLSTVAKNNFYLYSQNKVLVCERGKEVHLGIVKEQFYYSLENVINDVDGNACEIKEMNDGMRKELSYLKQRLSP